MRAFRPNKANKIELVEAPVGLAVAINGQRFDLIGRETYTRKDGAESELLVWQAECATCGVSFICRSPTDRFAEVRRCERHKQPGKAVAHTLPGSR